MILLYDRSFDRICIIDYVRIIENFDYIFIIQMFEYTFNIKYHTFIFYHILIA